jgi:hypothetical protein
MPRPGYIICSASGSHDEFTKQISLFNVVEAVQVEEVQAQPSVMMQVTPLQMRITAVWLKEETDSPEQEFETHLAVLSASAEGF